MTACLSIRRATTDDLLHIDALWQEAGRWLAKIEQDQWQYPLNSKRVEDSIGRGECWIITIADVAVATVTLDDYADPDFWAPSDDPQNALYLHRIIVNREWSGRNIGTSIIAWAVEQTKAAGKRWLRLDAWRSNEKLKSYYLKLGFDHVRTVSKPGRNSGELFQLDVHQETFRVAFPDAPRL